MKITRIFVNNYRILKALELDLENELSLIIGKNNCGKTSVLSILNKFIGDKSASNNFTYDDFNLDFRNTLYQHVVKNNNDWSLVPIQGIELYLLICYNKFDKLSNISPLIMDLDPNNNVVVLKYEYVISQESLNLLVSTFTDYYLRFSIEDENCIDKKTCFDSFMKNRHRHYFEIKRKTMQYDYVAKKPIESEYRIIDNNVVLNNVISFKYISARRDTENSDNDNTLSSLSSTYYEKTSNDGQNNPILQKFEDQLISTDLSLTGIYQNLFGSVLEKVKKFGGVRENETIVKIISTLSQKQLLKGNTTVVYEASNNQLPESYNGLGYLNLISIIFEIETILSQFRFDKDDSILPADINILLIEEPEAHTHPQMQYIFIKNIKKLLIEGSSGYDDKRKINLQTIITTHSSHIISECEFDDIKYFRKMSQTSVISKNLKDLEIAYSDEKDPNSNHYKFLKQYLTLNCAEIFFADKVILYEGDTERILLPAMMKKIDQETDSSESLLPLLSQNISIIEVGAYSQIFDKFISFLGTKTLIITDIDSGIEKKRDIPNKDGSYSIDIVSSPVDLGTHTTNGSLKHYYDTPLGKSLLENQLSFFINKSSSEKILASTDNSWVQDIDGSLMLVYQTRETMNGTSYYPRSFEDAFIHINRQFIIKNIDEFVSLKLKELFGERNSSNEYINDAYKLAEKCIKSKPSFAMDILLNSEKSGNTDFSNWLIPAYIKEGLYWLRKDKEMK